MLSPTIITIASLRVITYDLPGTRTTKKGETIDKNNTLIIIKTITRTIITITPSQSYCL
jgi:hypothetical protein